jgi:peptide/nickel transport system permease protein
MRFLSRPNAAIGATLLAIVFIAALVGVFWTPHDPVGNELALRLKAPSASHWLGTDEWGRDVLSRILVGAGTSVGIALATVALAVGAGVLIGAIVGYYGGWIDRIASSILDALLAFPGLFFAMAMIVVFGPSKYGVIFALGLNYLPSVARIVRGTVLSVREREFVDASRVMGNAEFFTLLRHVLPNCVAPVTVLATMLFGWALLAESSLSFLGFGWALLAESSLSFLGLGVPPPAPSWGGMLSDARQFVATSTWLAIAPGLCISIALLGVNLLGDAVRDALDPRMKNL